MSNLAVPDVSLPLRIWCGATTCVSVTGGFDAQGAQTFPAPAARPLPTMADIATQVLKVSDVDCEGCLELCSVHFILVLSERLLRRRRLSTVLVHKVSCIIATIPGT